MIIIVPDSMTLNNILVRQETGNQEPPKKKHKTSNPRNAFALWLGDWSFGQRDSPKETEPNIIHAIMKTWWRSKTSLKLT